MGEELLPKLCEGLRSGVLVAARACVRIIQPSPQIFTLVVERGLIEHDALQLAQENRLLINFVGFAVEMSLGQALPRVFLGWIECVECIVEGKICSAHGCYRCVQLQDLC